MTKKETLEAIKVMQAFADGKVIQFLDHNQEWQDIDPNKGMGSSWNWSGKDYRIKQESHYRPFKSAEEVMEAIKKHGDWVRTKSNIYYILKSFHYMGNNGYFFTDIHGNVSQSSMLADFVFADGTPFGVKEE